MTSSNFPSTETGAPFNPTGSFVSVPCPDCCGTLARRSHRNGLAETMLSAVFVDPFRCQICGRRFFALQWGLRHRWGFVNHRETDAREYHRHPVQIPALLSGRHGEYLGTTTDLSVGNCTLSASGPFHEGSRWSARLLLPSDPHPVIVSDAVVRTAHSRQIGLEFLQFASSGKQRFSRFIEATWKQAAAGVDERQPRPLLEASPADLGIQPGRSAAR
jgi:hypothetical protein